MVVGDPAQGIWGIEGWEFWVKGVSVFSFSAVQFWEGGSTDNRGSPVRDVSVFHG